MPAINDKPRLGFIGMGGMGSRMAARLLAAGYDVTIYNRHPEPTVFLERRGAKLTYSDPHVPHVRIDGLELCSDEAAMAKADCVVIVTAHSGFDYKALVGTAPLIVDTRNALKGVVSDKIVRL